LLQIRYSSELFIIAALRAFCLVPADMDGKISVEDFAKLSKYVPKTATE
jgi:hypothetical protein